MPRVWERGWLPGLLLVLGVFLAYQPAWNAGFIWDDDVYITTNPLLTAPDGLWRIWFSLDSPSQYFPLVYSSFRLEHALWGLHPAGYHWVNLVLHAANALLLWRLLKRLALPGAWLAAALFALHPVNVESVAWITERKNVLCLFFSLLTVRAWVEFIETRRWGWYGLALALYPWALFSKTTACTLPAALLLILWLKNRPVGWVRLAQVTPFVLLGLGMGLVTMWWERYHNGTQGAQFSLGLLERLLVAGHAVWFYLGKLVWPANLTFSYPRWNINPAQASAYGWLAAGAGLGVLIYWLRRRAGRGLETAAVFYVATLSPLLGFIMLYTFRYTFVADHYQYVAAIGPLALAAAGLARLFQRHAKSRPWLGPGVCAILLLSLTVLTWRQCGIYKDAETLWRKTIERSPSSYLAQYNLGVLLRAQGQLDEAIEHYRAGLKARPDFADMRFNLGNALLDKGEVDEAIVEFQKALELEPKSVRSHNNLSRALLQKGRVEEAAFHLQKALEIEPANPVIRDNLGTILLRQGNLNGAIAEFEKAVAYRPDFAPSYNNLAMAQLASGREDDAITNFQKTLALQSDNAMALVNLNQIAWVLATNPDASRRNGAKALELAQQIERISGGGNPKAIGTLAAAYAETSRFADAIAAAQRAVQLATAQTNTAAAAALQMQLRTYEANQPFRDSTQARPVAPK